MAKKKTRILWLSRSSGGGTYFFDTKEPEWDEVWEEWGGDEIYDFCNKAFERFFPSLKLHPNTKCKLKLTQLKNGTKLEKVK